MEIRDGEGDLKKVFAGRCPCLICIECREVARPSVDKPGIGS